MSEDVQSKQGQEKTETKRRITKEEIKNSLRLFHRTSKQKWEEIQKEGAILSERELRSRGLISDYELEDWVTSPTSTGEMDREIGNDRFVFLSHDAQNFGDTILEISPSILDQPGVVVNTAGDWLNFCNDEDLRAYYQDSQIPGTELYDYLERFVNELPNPEWFFGEGDVGAKREFVRQANIERAMDGNYDKWKIFWRLHPEIKVPDRLPLEYVVEVTDNSN